ncbi:unnamed protein product [Symbiodinium sp. CCMP2592]|nr:unnamed protein product [Symbiodinium sp. CCMP2592]
MLWLALPAMLYMFRGRLASTLAPMVGSLDPQRTAMLGHLLTVVLGLPGTQVWPTGDPQRLQNPLFKE